MTRSFTFLRLMAEDNKEELVSNNFIVVCANEKIEEAFLLI